MYVERNNGYFQLDLINNTLTILSKIYPVYIVVIEGDQQFKASCLMMIIIGKKLFTYTRCWNI